MGIYTEGKCWWIWQIQSMVCGYSQKVGVDYEETNPTTNIRVLMYKAVQGNLILHQMDVNTAYLHAQINCEIYMGQPEG